MTLSRQALRSVTALAFAVWALPVGAQKRQLVFVENSRSGDVSVIDAATLTVVGTIPTGLSPDDIVASPKGDMLYMSKIVRRTDGRPGGGGELVAIDPATQAIVWSAPLHGSPNHVAVAPDGKRVYVTLVSGPWVAVVDPAKHEVVDSIEVGTGPHDIEISRDGKRGYVGLIRGTDVVVFDPATNKVLMKIPVGDNVRPLTLSHDGNRLYVQRSRNHSFLVIDAHTGQILKTVAMPVPPGFTLPDSMPTDVNHGIKFTADGKYLIANGSLVDLVAIYSMPSMELAGTVPVGRDPNWITFSMDGKRAFISNRRSDDVSVIDIATRKEVARIKVGKYPQRMTSVAVGK